MDIRLLGFQAYTLRKISFIYIIKKFVFAYFLDLFDCIR